VQAEPVQAEPVQAEPVQAEPVQVPANPVKAASPQKSALSPTKVPSSEQQLAQLTAPTPAELALKAEGPPIAVDDEQHEAQEFVAQVDRAEQEAMPPPVAPAPTKLDEPAELVAADAAKLVTGAAAKWRQEEKELLAAQHQLLATQDKLEQRQAVVARAVKEVAVREHKLRAEQQLNNDKMKAITAETAQMRTKLNEVFKSERLAEAAELEAKAKQLRGVTGSSEEKPAAVKLVSAAAPQPSVAELAKEMQELKQRLEASDARAAAAEADATRLRAAKDWSSQHQQATEDDAAAAKLHSAAAAAAAHQVGQVLQAVAAPVVPPPTASSAVLLSDKSVQARRPPAQDEDEEDDADDDAETEVQLTR